MNAGNYVLRTRRWWAFVPLALVASVLAYAAESTGAYAIQEHAVSTANAWTLTVDGQWPTQCPPSLKNVALDGNDLRIDARSDLTLCDRKPMPFSIELNPALAIDKTALDPGVYHVSFYAADGAGSAPKLRAFSLVDRSASDAVAVVPESGFWFTANNADVSTNRSVLSIELQEGQLSVALMSYDSIGQPLWYFGAAPFNGHIAHVPLVHIVGGSDPFNPSTSSARGDAVLTLDLQFQSGAHALAWLSRDRGTAEDSTLQIQEMDLVRLPLSDSNDGHAWQGDWIVVADAEETPPLRLHLTQFRAVDAQHFELTTANGDASLVCTRESAQPEWPLSSCALHQANGTLVAAFDSVALARMDGQDNTGAAIHLLRISR
ncbi:MAG: hypothetical protein ABJB01_01005 [Rudaea sp.]